MKSICVPLPLPILRQPLIKPTPGRPRWSNPSNGRWMIKKRLAIKMKALLLALSLVSLAACAKHPEVFYCGKASRMCYDKTQRPDFEQDINYIARPTAFCFNGYLDSTPLGFTRSYVPFRSCYVSMSECQTQRLVDDFKWVDGTILPCQEDLPAKGGTGYDLKEFQQQSHM